MPYSASKACNCFPAARHSWPMKWVKSAETSPSALTAMVSLGGRLAMQHPRNHHLLIVERLGGNLSVHPTKRGAVRQNDVVLDNHLLDLRKELLVRIVVALEGQRTRLQIHQQANATRQEPRNMQCEVGIGFL